MKNLIFCLSIIVLFLSCDKEEVIIEEPCGVNATVVDMSGLDGCGYILELENGDRLEAVWRWGWCGTPPLPEGAVEDPLYDFTFFDGQKVNIAYEPSDMASICMAGTPVIITCIEDITVFMTNRTGH